MPAARAILIVLAAALAAFTSGCAHSSLAGAGHASSGPEYQPQNYRQGTAWLPRELHRVAVLPLTSWSDSIVDESSRAQLERLLVAELSQSELFEVVVVSPAQLRRWTGRSNWGVTDALPPDLLSRIHDQLACEGVIFAHVTAYRAYPPLAVGWKLHLVNAEEPAVWWASDVVYDAGDQAVARSAVRFEKESLLGRSPAADPPMILRSPLRFGQYTVAASLETLQRHENSH